MALKHKTVTYTRKLNDTDELYIDSSKAANYVSKIDAALAGLSQQYNYIERAYSNLAKSSSTKGVYKENALAARKASAKRSAYCYSRRGQLKNRMKSDVQKYVNNTMGKELDALKKEIAELRSAAEKKDANLQANGYKNYSK